MAGIDQPSGEEPPGGQALQPVDFSDARLRPPLPFCANEPKFKLTAVKKNPATVRNGVKGCREFL